MKIKSRPILKPPEKVFHPIDKAPQTNQDSGPKSVPTLELHSWAASSVGITSPFQRSQHRKQFQRKVDNKKTPRNHPSYTSPHNFFYKFTKNFTKPNCSKAV